MPKNNKPELKKWDTFNRFTIIEFSHSDNRWRKWYKVNCLCWTEKIVMGSAMQSWNTKSCWCLWSETRKSKRIPNNFSEINAVILWYKRHAKRRWFDWKLERYFIEKIVRKDCFYCWLEPSNYKKLKNSIWDWFLYSWIDRLDSLKNYTEDNVVPCCRICNFAKSNLTISEFREWALRIWNKAIAEQWSNL